jgi:hypothetical protein
MLRYASLLALALFACSGPAPYATTVGILQPGKTLSVKMFSGDVNAYAPANGEPRNRFTIEATASDKNALPAAPVMRPARDGVGVDALAPLRSLLVRVPDGVALRVDSARGDVRVTNVTGTVDVHATQGTVQIIVPSYAQASVGTGNLSVTMGSTDWPGTLRFSTQSGDIEVWINENAQFDVHLHTDNGMLFTDFALRGTSSGTAETIDGPVNGGGPRRIDIESNAGAIRLLKLHPEA